MDTTVRETVNASKERYAAKDLSDLFDGARKIVVAKGKTVLTFDMKKDPPTKAELAKAVIGPSGNLRAPTIRTGTTWLVGFNEEAFAGHFG